jgi:hypothetical protein
MGCQLDLFKTDLPTVAGGTVDAKYLLMGGGSLGEATYTRSPISGRSLAWPAFRTSPSSMPNR